MPSDIEKTVNIGGQKYKLFISPQLMAILGGGVVAFGGVVYLISRFMSAPNMPTDRPSMEDRRLEAATESFQSVRIGLYEEVVHFDLSQGQLGTEEKSIMQQLVLLRATEIRLLANEMIANKDDRPEWREYQGHPLDIVLARMQDRFLAEIDHLSIHPSRNLKQCGSLGCNDIPPPIDAATLLLNVLAIDALLQVNAVDLGDSRVTVGNLMVLLGNYRDTRNAKLSSSGYTEGVNLLNQAWTDHLSSKQIGGRPSTSQNGRE